MNFNELQLIQIDKLKHCLTSPKRLGYAFGFIYLNMLGFVGLTVSRPPRLTGNGQAILPFPVRPVVPNLRSSRLEPVFQSDFVRNLMVPHPTIRCLMQFCEDPGSCGKPPWRLAFGLRSECRCQAPHSICI